MHLFPRTLLSQHRHSLHNSIRIVPKRAINPQSPISILKRNLRSMRLLERIPIIKIKTTFRLAIKTRSNDQLEALLPEVSSCSRARGPDGNDIAAADVH